MVGTARLFLPSVFIVLHRLSESSSAPSHEDAACLLQAIPKTSGERDAPPSGERSKLERRAVSGAQTIASRVSTQLNKSSFEGKDRTAIFGSHRRQMLGHFGARELGGGIVKEPPWQETSNSNIRSGHVHEVDMDSPPTTQNTNLPLSPINEFNADQGTRCDYVVYGAGATSTNGCYLLNGTFNGRSKYSQLSGGGTIYWNFGWKLNYRDSTTGWYYFATSNASTPPVGLWTTEGDSSLKGAQPAPTLSTQASSPWQALRQILEVFVISVVVVILCVCFMERKVL